MLTDDAPKGLDYFPGQVEDEHEYTMIHWPTQSGKPTVDPAPDIFVSDLYLPSSAGDNLRLQNVQHNLPTKAAGTM